MAEEGAGARRRRLYAERLAKTEARLAARRADLGYQASAAVALAIRTGRLVRPEVCEQCGSGGPIEAHHPDYEKPLDVRWLCKPCHRAEHPGGIGR